MIVHSKNSTVRTYRILTIVAAEGKRKKVTKVMANRC